VKNLVADLVGLLDALELEQAVFIGHDWGSMPAWYAGAYAPERVAGAASLCTPYFTPGEVDLIEAYNELRGPNHYMATFQTPGVGEAMLERDVEATFRALIRGRGMTLEEFRAAPPEVQEVPAGVFVGDPQLFGGVHGGVSPNRLHRRAELVQGAARGLARGAGPRLRRRQAGADDLGRR
jgi:pimeloyl-ACP methyl ester carboxylesterase